LLLILRAILLLASPSLGMGPRFGGAELSVEPAPVAGIPCLVAHAQRHHHLMVVYSQLAVIALDVVATDSMRWLSASMKFRWLFWDGVPFLSQSLTR
jgi:hypothetical protein